MLSELPVLPRYNGDDIFNNIENFNPYDYLLTDIPNIEFLLNLYVYYVYEKEGEPFYSYVDEEGKYKYKSMIKYEKEELESINISSGSYGVVCKYHGGSVIKFSKVFYYDK